MPTINRTPASAQQIADAKTRKFAKGNAYLFANNSSFTFASCDFIAHEIDGQKSQNAKLVINLQGTDQVIYLSQLVKDRFGLDGTPIAVRGTLNAFVLTLLGKTEEEVQQAVNDRLNGKQITAFIAEYAGYQRSGEKGKVQYNYFDCE